MTAARSPIYGDQIQQPKDSRKPLQPRNILASPPINNYVKLKPKSEWIAIFPAVDSKENHYPLCGTPARENHHLLCSAPAKIESFDASLAEELSAIRQKLKRLRSDKEKTEKLLRERDLMLDKNTKELQRRGKLQKQLEIEVDKLFRLKGLNSSCMRISPIRSLREKEQGRKSRIDEQSQANTHLSRPASSSPLISSSSEIEVSSAHLLNAGGGNASMDDSLQQTPSSVINTHK